MPTLGAQVSSIDSTGRLHALCAPSSSDRWFYCTGSVAMEASEPDTPSEYSERGDWGHTMAARWLTSKFRPIELLNDADMNDIVEIYVETVFETVQRLRFEGAEVEILVEQRLPLFEVTGERGAEGTVDCILIARFPGAASHMYVFDLKAGRGVEVDDDTLQLPVYALAAIVKFGLMDDFKHVYTIIVQPAFRSTPTFVQHQIEDLLALGDQIRGKAREALQIFQDGPATATAHLQVTEKGCRFCKAQHKCPAKIKQVHDTVYGEMQDLTQPGIVPIDETTHTGSAVDFAALLPLFMSRVHEIETWCSYVRAKVESLLVEGKSVPGWKLVTGRAGHRAWRDADAVVKVCFGANLTKEMFYTLPEVRSPTDLEKRLKKAYPNVWETLQTLVTRAPSKPSVAPATDPRPEYAPVFDGDSYDGSDLV